jgi:hypothetical protein
MSEGGYTCIFIREGPHGKGNKVELIVDGLSIHIRIPNVPPSDPR